MKSIPILLQDHYNQPTTSVWKILRVFTKDEQLFGFTEGDANITYDPAAYDPENTGDTWGSAVHRARNGFTPERLQASADMSVDNTDLLGWVSDSGITEAQLRTGLFDYAEVRVYKINFLDTGMGHELVMSGTLGETDFSQLSWRTEFRSLTQQLKQPLSDLYSVSCTKQFASQPFGTGGEEPEEEYPCGKFYVWHSATVTSVDSDEPDRVFTADGLGQGSGYFYPGVIKVTSGPNLGAQMEIDEYESTDSSGEESGFVLSLPLPFNLSPGDTFDVRQDCNKLLYPRDGQPGDCRDKHDNVLEYGGDFEIPIHDGGTLMVPGARIRQ